MDTDGIMTDEDLLTPEASSTPEEENVFSFNGANGPPGSVAAATAAQQRELSRRLREDRDCVTRFLDAVLDFLSFFNCFRSVRSMEIYRKPHIVFNRVDKCCRKLFPFVFFLVNLLYWFGYMYM